MFKNYLLTAYRNFRINKVISLIHISGLAIGISAALVIFLIVYYEYSFDKFEPGRDKIFRVVLDANFNGTEGHSAAVPAPMGGAIANEITGVDLTVPVFQFPGDGMAKVSVASSKSDNPVVYKNQKDIVFTNSEYFQLLPFKWITGSSKTSLNNPFSIVLTESRAHQYFPLLPLNAIPGRQITYNDDLHVTVSGIVKDLKENTSFSGQEFISLPTIINTNLKDRFMMTVWNDWMAYSHLYIKLAKGSSIEGTELKIKSMYAKYNMNEKNDSWKSVRFRLQPLNDIHFNSKYPGFGQRVAHKPTLYGLLAVAAFLLLLG
ncbi:MAG TPA: ABC transporter permease, partial [Flavisolibacter sp.]|nr:ABC transporter permease [Flavisolibacter sp.]